MTTSACGRPMGTDPITGALVCIHCMAKEGEACKAPETTDFERAIELSAKAGIKTQPIFLDAYRVMRDAERRLCILDHALGQLRALVAQACDQIEADASSSAWHARFVEIGREELARDVE